MHDIELKDDFITIEKAIKYAEKRGYVVPPLEKAMFTGISNANVSNSLRVWAIGLMTTQDFASKFFGTEEVDYKGHDFAAIKLWVKQFAVKYKEKIYNAPQDSQYLTLVNYPEVKYDFTSDMINSAPAQIVDAEKVTIKLEELAASIPFETHKLEDVEVYQFKSWEYHLQQMIISPNPIKYLKIYMEEHAR